MISRIPTTKMFSVNYDNVRSCQVRDIVIAGAIYIKVRSPAKPKYFCRVRRVLTYQEVELTRDDCNCFHIYGDF